MLSCRENPTYDLWPVRAIGLVILLVALGGCALTLEDQPRFEAQEASAFFADGGASRPRIADTVARGELRLDPLLTSGRVGGRFIDSFPFTVTQTLLERGQQRYDIFCSPCHGLTGDGQGVITEYGMPNPESFHSPELRDRQAGYYFAIISDGTRVMPSYAARIPVADRWAIVAYIRALQLSQNVDAGEIPPEKLP
ncbi:MAG: cytochrome c [Chloroflexi bacterium]|nr:cytochrome c [Chloroflexota bacterium]